MENKKCVQCGKEFMLTDSELKFFENRNLNVPKRCKECRGKNNPHQGKIDTNRQPIRKEKSFTIRKIYPFFIILFIALSILYSNSRNSSRDYQNEQYQNEQYQIKQDSILQNSITQDSDVSFRYNFKSEKLLQEHFTKHGGQFEYTTTFQYVSGANEVINSPNALHKTEAEDGDGIYYIQTSNEFVILSTDGYIRTYFKPEDGIAYYNRQ